MSDASEQPEPFDLRSHVIAEDKREELLRLFPAARTEGGQIDFDRLKRALGETVDPGRERYGMVWPGKADCSKTIQQPSLATLLPARDESVDFDTTENLIIEGDNLEVLKLLQKSYLGKVKMIYIDPPYNTGNDFIYPDDYSETLQTYLEYTGQIDSEGRRFSTNTEADGRFHSKWLNMMYPRLYLAWNLLKDKGLLLVSSDDNESSNLRKILDEVFGEENFVAQLVWNTEGHTDNQFDVKINHEYVVVYARNADAAELGHVVDPNTRKESNLWKGYAENSITKNGPGNPPSEITLPVGFSCAIDDLDLAPSELSTGFFDDIRASGYITRATTTKYSAEYPVRFDRMIVRNGLLSAPCRVFSGWANVNKLRAYIANSCEPVEDRGDNLSFLLSPKGVIYYRRTRTKARNIVSVLRNMGTTERMRSELEQMGIEFQYPKPKELLKYLIKIAMDESGMALDFFAGSGTTAQAVLELNKQDGGDRTFILVQLPEPTGREDYPTIADICKERVRRVIKKLNEEDAGKLALDGEAKQDRGFRVFKLAGSNFKTWTADVPQGDVAALEEQLAMHVDHLIADRTAEDRLYELLLKSGFPVTTHVETLTLDGKTVYSVQDGAMLVCLDQDLAFEAIKAMADKKPERVVCLDEGFAGNDQLKTNAVQTMKGKNIVFRTV